MTLKECILGFLLSKGADPSVVHQILKENEMDFPGFTSELVDPEKETDKLEFLFRQFEKFTPEDMEKVNKFYDTMASKARRRN